MLAVLAEGEGGGTFASRSRALPSSASQPALARHVMVVSEGNAVHAAAGVPREALLASVKIAMRAIPAGANASAVA